MIVSRIFPFVMVMFSLSVFFSSVAFAQFPFKWKKPLSVRTQQGATSPDNRAAGEGRPFPRMLSLSAPIEKSDMRNYFQIADIIDTNKVLLDSGDIVCLAGLMSEVEIDRFKQLFPVDSGMKVLSARTMIIDFMRSYLSERTVRVSFVAHGKKNAEELPLVYLYDEDGENINDLLVYEGYGVVSYQYPLDFHAQLIASQNEARSFGNGIWR